MFQLLATCINLLTQSNTAPVRIAGRNEDGKMSRNPETLNLAVEAILRKMASAPFERPHVNYTIGRDKNGNKTLRCSSVEGGFSIQTNGNLPHTHRDGVTEATDAEVCAYVRRHGGDRRRRILGI